LLQKGSLTEFQHCCRKSHAYADSRARRDCTAFCESGSCSRASAQHAARINIAVDSPIIIIHAPEHEMRLYALFMRARIAKGEGAEMHNLGPAQRGCLGASLMVLILAVAPCHAALLPRRHWSLPAGLHGIRAPRPE
jgi:hypothetical protein